ncbi:YwbE family protein [candidate division WWE3 bacterium]|nr:YwbE family protein [candidate division WWE3 bacterium]
MLYRDKQEQAASVPPRSAIAIGTTVWGLEKRNYASGVLTSGTVQRILTSKPFHPRGIKVMLQDGTVVRVQTLEAPTVTTKEQTETTSPTSFDEDFDLR